MNYRLKETLSRIPRKERIIKLDLTDGTHDLIIQKANMVPGDYHYVDFYKGNFVKKTNIFETRRVPLNLIPEYDSIFNSSTKLVTNDGMYINPQHIVKYKILSEQDSLLPDGTPDCTEATLYTIEKI